VLVTSRIMRAAMQVVQERDIIPIEPMHDATAQFLLHLEAAEHAAELCADSVFFCLALHHLIARYDRAVVHHHFVLSRGCRTSCLSTLHPSYICPDALKLGNALQLRGVRSELAPAAQLGHPHFSYRTKQNLRSTQTRSA
jgi:hypothetical protein